MSFKIFYLSALTLLLIFSSVFAQQDLEICAIRVEFVEDENDLTTGNGRFVLDTSGVTPYTVDPPPHNRTYFQDQIIAVGNYYLDASKGLQTISGKVYPSIRDLSYQLSHTMGYYSPNSTEEENNYQLAQLFIDAVLEADKDPNISFSNYDVVTIFHAGVGKDINIGFDETPQDIPSLYFTPEFFKKWYDPNFNGIEVDDGNTIIDRGILLPETESQVDIEIALTGIFASNIGSHLGMYDLFSPTDQQSGIGVFGIMDSGLFNALGLLPAMPSAFSRELMGWEEVTIISAPMQDINVNRFAGYDSQGKTLYRIPLNTSEYFLLEFRGDRDINIDSMYFELAEGRDVPPTYLEVLKTYLSDEIDVSDSSGVLLSVGDYDWGLPGSGILIWHIDGTIIEEKGEQNKINDDKTNRAVDLEEADGSQDIGYEYTIVEPGFQSELGTWIDFWFLDNPSPLNQNEFSVNTSPNTRANRTLANSHITLSDFSSNYSDIMTFSLEMDFFEPGFPVFLSDSSVAKNYSNPMLANLEYQDLNVILTTNEDGNIYAITSEGKGIFDPTDNLIAIFPDQEIPNLSLCDTNSNGRSDQVIASGKSGLILGYRVADINGDNQLDTLFQIDLGEKVSYVPVIYPPYFYIGTEAGNIHRITYDGVIDSVYHFSSAIAAFTVVSPEDIEVTYKSTDEPPYAPVIVDINSDGSYETIRYPDYNTIDTEAGLIHLEASLISEPAFADLDDDGFYEIAYNSESGIYLYNYNGTFVSNFPVFPVLQENETFTGTPMVFDADGDQKSDIILTTTFGQVFAYNQKAQLLSGFPFTAAGDINNSAAVMDIDEDNLLEVFVVNQNSMVYGWELSSSVDNNNLWWTQAVYNSTNNSYISVQLTASGLPASGLMPEKSAYVYPNPNIDNYVNIRYYLSESASVDIKIFDLAGDIVQSFPGPGQGMIDNEIRWNVENVSSGIYLCRIEAVSGNDKAVKIIKIMVIK